MLIQKSILLAATVGVIVAAQPAAPQQIGGRNGYSFPARNPSLAAQFQFQRQNGVSGGTASTAAGLGALNQYVTTYSSNSTSIGNMNTVNQVLSEGSQGSVGQSTDQQSTGDQGSQADTNATVDNSIVSTQAATESSSGSSESASSNAGATTTTTTTTTTQPAN